MQTSGAMRRENATLSSSSCAKRSDPVFQSAVIEAKPRRTGIRYAGMRSRHCERSEAIHLSMREVDCFAARNDADGPQRTEYPRMCGI